ncbi:MAG: 50S ribosomal protein L25/general stress protein Ctc [Pseudanabaenales cyanobacterium]|nr:50S ribosomal protein L25/general stress protein Ctc [Pseudanabaenales cyanobacterium]
MELSIECGKRTSGQKTKALRREGLLPAVLYGHNGAESVALTVNAKEAEMLLRRVSVNNTLIQVKVPEISWSGPALLREVQTHPWKNAIYHLSFFSVAAQAEVAVTVPLNYIGEAEGVKNGGGTLDTILTEIQLKCPPNAIPETVDIDISTLDVGHILQLKDLVLPTGITAVGDPEALVVNVLSPKGGAASGEEGAEAAATAVG